MDISITPAHHWQAIDLAPRLREADKKEVYASSGMNPEDALTESLLISDINMCWCAMLDGVPEIMWGVSHVTDEIGGVWLLGSDRISEIPRRFIREARHYIEVMHEKYPVLTNYVHTDNIKSLMWLSLLGFHIGGQEPYGHLGQKFRRITSCASQ